MNPATELPVNDPVSLLSAISADCRSLDAVGAALGEAIKKLANAEIEYQDAYDAALLDADASSKEKREAQARLQVPVELRGRVKRLAGEVEGLKHYARIRSASLNGRQTQLSTLKAESRFS